MIVNIACKVRLANNISFVVDTNGCLQCAPERAKIRHDSVLPEERVFCRKSCRGIWGVIQIRVPRYLIVFIDDCGECILAAECPNVQYPRTRPPEERPR